MTERERFLETLRAAHTFPARYTFKLIGENQPSLLDEALSRVKAALPNARPEVSRRESDKGNHQSLTLVMTVPDPETVHDLYTSFRDIEGLRMLL